MLDMGRMTPSQVQGYKRLSPKMRRWAEPQEKSRPANDLANMIHMIYFGPLRWRLLNRLRARESFSILFGQNSLAHSDWWKALWPKSRQAKIKYVQFRKRSNLNPTNDELGLDNIFANYEDKAWWWIIFLHDNIPLDNQLNWTWNTWHEI